MSGKKRRLFRLIFTTCIFAGFAFMLGFSYKYHLPQLEAWMLLEVEQATDRHAPVRVWPQKLKFSVFPVGVKIYDVKIMPKNEIRNVLAPAHVDEVHVNLSIIDLFRGQVRISEVFFKNPDIIAFVREEKKQKPGFIGPKRPPKKIDFSFKQLANIPVESIRIEGMKLKADIQPANLRIKSDHINALFENKYNALLVDLNVPDLQTKLYDQKYLMKYLLETRLLVQDRSVNVSAIKLKRQQTYLVGSGVAQGKILGGDIRSIKGSLRTQVHLKSSLEIAKKLFPDVSLPNATGTVSLETTTTYEKGKSPRSNFTLKTKKVFLEGYEIGNLNALGSYKNDQINYNNLGISNSAGKVIVKNATQSLKGKMPLKADIDIRSLELAKLLASLQIPDVPLRLDLVGGVPCSGQLNPFTVTCTGKINAKTLHVWSDSPKDTIVKAKDMLVSGTTTVDAEKVTYKADLEVGEAKGKSDGVISYEKGFDINYESPSVDFKNIDDLVGLKLEGSTEIKGRTWGTSDWAQIAMDINAKDLWLEDHALGTARAKLTYKKSMLGFKNLRGKLGSSLYSGIVSINLQKPSIYLNVRSKYADLEDVQKAFSRRGTLPFDFSGTGTAAIKAWGPLEFSKLSYNLRTELYRGTLFDESYDEIKGELNAKTGNVKVKSLNLTKANSFARFTGTIDPEGILKTRIVGTNFRLGEFNRVRKWGLNLDGRLDFAMSLTDFILTPDLKIDGNLKELLIAGEPQQDSSFKVDFNDNSVSGNGEFIGGTIVTDFDIPTDTKLPFKFKMKTKEWDFIKLFNLVSSSALKRNYKTRLSMDVDLSAPTGGFWSSSGRVVIPQFRVQRNNLLMTAPKPMELRFNRGSIRAKNFKISNEKGDEVQLTARNLSKKNLKMQLKGQFDLGLAAILTPLDDIGGEMNFTINSSGSIEQPKIIGDAFVKNSFARIPQFPHVFEEINADVLFNEKRLLVNSARARLGGGPLIGSGRILFNGFKNIPMEFNGDLTNAKLHIPDGIKTEGSGTLFLKGSWFPYTLGGTYTVNNGTVEKEFTGSGDGQTIQPSSFLPKFLSEDNFSILNLNLDVILSNPIILKNSLAEIPIRGRTKVLGPVDKPVLTGLFNLDPGGRVSYQEVEFELETGNVRYQNSDPENPNLYVTATSQVESQDVNYDITLLLQGQAKDPKIKLTSTPPLEEQDIVSLLGFGYTRSDLEKIDQDQQAAQTSYQIGSAILATPFGRQIKDTIGADILITSDIGDDNKTEPKVTLKKRINKKLGASASRTLGTVPKTKITGEYKVNDNLSVIGFWDSTERNEVNKNDDNLETIGIDLEYKIPFK